MSIVRLGIVVLAAGLLAAAPDDSDKVKKDVAALKGKWALTGMTINGRAYPENLLKSIGATFDAKTYAQTQNGKALEEGEFVIDPEKSPKALDFKITKGPDAGKTQLAVYEIDGDSLTFCVTEAGSKKRPEALEAKADTGVTMFVFKRVKD